MKVGIIFPGYGNALTDEGKDLYDNFRLIQDYVEEASQCLGIDFYKMCFITAEQERRKARNFFPLICTWEYALYKVLEQEGVHPTAFLAQDHGFYAALTSAGSITFPDSLYVSTKLADWYEEVIAHHQLQVRKVVNITHRILKKICQKVSDASGNKVCIAASYDTHLFFVIGTSNSIELLGEHLKAGEGSLKNVPGMLYGLPLVCYADSQDKFEHYLPKIDIKDPRVPLIGYQGKMFTTSVQLHSALLDQLDTELQWDTMLKLFTQTVDVGIIMGYAPELHKTVQEQYPTTKWFMLATMDDFKQIQLSLSIL